MTSKIEVPRELLDRAILAIEHGTLLMSEAVDLADELRGLISAPEAPRQSEPVAWRVTGRGGLTVTTQYPDWAVGDGAEGLHVEPLYASPLSPDHSGGGAGMVANDELQAIQDRHEAWKAGEAHGIESAARLIEKRMEDYINEHGSFDPETGAVEFPGSGEEYVGELVEISEAIRTLDKVKELNQ